MHSTETIWVYQVLFLYTADLHELMLSELHVMKKEHIWCENKLIKGCLDIFNY